MNTTGRNSWRRLSSKKRREVMARARSGERHPDPVVAAVAEEWATAMLTTPWWKLLVTFLVRSLVFLILVTVSPLHEDLGLRLTLTVMLFLIWLIFEQTQRAFAKAILRC